jgi:hypothetical protein
MKPGTIFLFQVSKPVCTRKSAKPEDWGRGGGFQRLLPGKAPAFGQTGLPNRRVKTAPGSFAACLATGNLCFPHNFACHEGQGFL